MPWPLPDARRRTSGISVRLRITLTVALLVAITLTGAGFIVQVVEIRRLDEHAAFEVEQEFEEFDRLLDEPGSFDTLEEVFRAFLMRNVPDDDELMVGWVDDRPVVQFPPDSYVKDPVFLEVAREQVVTGGSARLDTDRGPLLIAAQPVEYGPTGESGALVMVIFLAEDRQELYDTLRTYAIVALLSLGLVTAAAFWQSGKLLAPLRTLRETAEEISATDLSLRLPVTGRDDITALTLTVNGMLDRLEAAFVGQRQFLDDAGHELKTPLTVLRGHLELVDENNPAEVAETRVLLLEEIDRMARLVGDLILLAKSNRPDFVTRAPTDLATLTEELVSKARGLGDRAWELDGVGRTEVPLDEQRITQAVLQLCDNAVKHTRPGDTIAIGSSYDGLRARLWVRDTGPGIAPVDRRHIFTRFGRSEIAVGDEGFGLGLSIVQAIVEAHGGAVAVGDADPPGALFTITLPIRPSPVDEPLQEAPWPTS